MKIVNTLLLVIVVLQLTACATQQSGERYQYGETRIVLSGFIPEQRKQIENRLHIDDLRMVECSVRSCEYWYHGSHSTTDLYRKLQHSMGVMDLDLPANIEVDQNAIMVTAIRLKKKRRVAPGNRGW